MFVSVYCWTERFDYFFKKKIPTYTLKKITKIHYMYITLKGHTGAHKSNKNYDYFKEIFSKSNSGLLTWSKPVIHNKFFNSKKMNIICIILNTNNMYKFNLIRHN